MKLDSFFAQHTVFTYQEFLDYLQSTGSSNTKSIWQLLNYHENAGNILRIRRGFYASVPRGSDQSMLSVNPYLVAGRINNDSVLSYHTALDIHGFAHSIFYTFYFFTQKSIRPFTFQDSDFKAVKTPKSLIIKQAENFAVTSVNRDGLDIRVTTLERTLVDMLDRPDYAGGWEEIWSSFIAVPLLNLEQVIQYALLLGNATTIAKLGFFLEIHREQFKVDEKHLKQLEEHKPLQNHYLERSKRATGKLTKRWNLIVPEEIIKRQWEEPSEIF
jgi:predicted transcriptional regulator of viral defense system